MIINLLSGPRNISTTMMYSFAQRADTEVIDEPFYAYHLQHHDIDHPGREATLAAMPTEATAILDDIHHRAQHTPVLFLKNMPHHMAGLDLETLLDFQNVFLIRDPARMITSFTKVVSNPATSDFALDDQWRVFQWLTAQGRSPAVINAQTVLHRPEESLNALCRHLNLDADPAMLSWESGPKPYDGPWAEYWYSNVHKSTGFGHARTDQPSVPKGFEALHEAILPAYQSLNKHALTFP